MILPLRGLYDILIESAPVGPSRVDGATSRWVGSVGRREHCDDRGGAHLCFASARANKSDSRPKFGRQTLNAAAQGGACAQKYAKGFRLLERIGRPGAIGMPVRASPSP